MAGKTLNYDLDTRNFASPAPIIGRLAGFTPEFTAKIISARLQYFTQLSGRAATPEEAQLTGLYTAKEVATISWGNPLGAAGGIYISYANKDRFRFPFYQPNLETFPKTTFPSVRMPWLTGNAATLAWHGLRGACYGLLGSTIGVALLTSYATSVRIVAEAQDPRLKDMRDDVLAGVRKQKGGVPNTPRAPGAVDGVREQDASALWRDYTRGGMDDASPSGGSGMYGDLKEEEGKAVTANQTRGSWERASNRSSQQRQETSEPAPFFGGDGEGTSGDEAGRESQPASTGSAWDRVRMQSNTQNKGKTSSWSTRQSPSADDHSYQSADVDRQLARDDAQTQKDFAPRTSGWATRRSPSVDEHSYSSANVERQLARDDAQKDFDARIEKERRGGDFSGGGDQRRW